MVGYQVVIDTSISACWILEDENSDAAEQCLRSILEGKLHIVQPSLWIYENVNLLRTAVIRKRLTQSLAYRAMDLLRQIPAEVVPPNFESFSGVLKLAFEHGLSGYDASYLHLAESKGIQLLTADKDLLKLRRQYNWIKPLEKMSF